MTVVYSVTIMAYLLIILRGNISLNSLDGIGSKTQVDSFKEEIMEVSWLRSIGEKLSRYISGVTAGKNIPVVVDTSVLYKGNSRLIWSLRVWILSLKMS